MTFWDQRRDFATRQIKRRGFKVTITLPGTPGTYNPATGMVEGGTPGRDLDLWLLGRTYDQSTEPGTMIQVGDFLGTIAYNEDAQTFIESLPGNGWQPAGGQSYTVRDVQRVAPGGVLLCWKVHIANWRP